MIPKGLWPAAARLAAENRTIGRGVEGCRWCILLFFSFFSFTTKILAYDYHEFKIYLAFRYHPPLLNSQTKSDREPIGISSSRLPFRHQHPLQFPKRFPFPIWADSRRIFFASDSIYACYVLFRKNGRTEPATSNRSQTLSGSGFVVQTLPVSVPSIE